MKKQYVYPAILDYSKEGISIFFPDLPGCFSYSESEENAAHNAREALGLHLWSMEDDGDVIPEPSSARDVKKKADQVVILVDVWMPPIREKLNNRAVKKTLTIPYWLNALAEKENINFSQALQKVLKEILGLKTAA